MKKILFMVSSMNIGGVEKSLLSLLGAMNEDKYDVTILLLEKKGGFLEYIPDWVKVEEATWFKDVKSIIMQSPQQTIKDYYSEKKYNKILPFMYVYFKDKYTDDRYSYYKNILKNVPENKEEYDVAIAYQGPTDTIDYYIANKVKAKKKISWIHFDISKHATNFKLYNKLYDKFDKIFVVSKEAHKQLVAKIPIVKYKSEVFFNIVSSEFINKMSKIDIELYNNYKGIKIVTVGRLSKEKGQDMAIKTLAKLKQDGYDARWYCVGDGNARNEYEKLIKEYNLKDEFILIGATPNPYPYIQQADIYVQTSRHEGYCLTLAEAKCLNKPIVTTNFIGAYDQIVDNKNGFIVGCNEEDMYEKIKYLIDNEGKRKLLINSLLKEDIDTQEEINKLINYIE